MSLVVTYDRQEDASFRERKNKSSFLLVGSIAFDDSYPTDGELMDLSGLFKDLQIVMFEGNGGYVFEYDYTAKKVIVKYPTKAEAVHAHDFTGEALAVHKHKQNFTTGSTAIAAAENGALVEDAAGDETVVRFPNTAIDTTYELGEGEEKTAGTPAGTNADDGAIAAGVAEEVENEADLSALTDVRFVAIGF